MIDRLYPICRSLTGDGVRQSLRILQETADFDIREVPTGTQVYDWQIPDEWNITGAVLEGPSGVIADFAETNLRLMGYSEPVDLELTYAELAPHLYTHPNPDAIPYRTSYYKRGWGFCLRQAELEHLDKNASYHVKINSTIEPGSMTYGEYYHPGISGKTYLVSTYSCHPSMYNDNLSGMLAWAKLLRIVQTQKTYHSYYFFIGPETLGVLSLLSRVSYFDGAMVVSCVGSDADYIIKSSILENSDMDRAVKVGIGAPYTALPFSVNGSDERQLQSPGFRIPTININRGNYYQAPWYHNSTDEYTNNIAPLEESVTACHNILMALDCNRKIYSLSPFGEPQLGKRGLYPPVSGANEKDQTATVAKWIMHNHSGTLFDVAEKTGQPMASVSDVHTRMVKAGLVKCE